MTAKHPNFEDFPDSPYARELSRVKAGRRFVAPMEAEYRISHLRRIRLRVRAWLLLSALLAVGFSTVQLLHTGLGSVVALAQVTLLIPCIAALCWLVWGRHYERHFLVISPFLLAMLNALNATFIAIAIASGRPEELAALTVNLVAMFFFTGLMYRQALLISGITFAFFAGTAIVVGLPTPMLLKSLLVMSLTSLIAAIVYRDVERAYRRSFLEGALLSELATRDGLSGLMNRRAFDEHLLRVWQQALRDQRVMAVLMVDIDHFKRYNDCFGHQAGDLALRRVARVIQGFACRPLDLAARYGGEEFAIILYDLAIPHVRDIAERLRESVQALKIKTSEDAGSGPTVTVSVGVGLVLPAIGRTPKGAVQLADEALYDAKTAGRNCSIVHGMDAYRLLDTGRFSASRNSRQQ